MIPPDFPIDTPEKVAAARVYLKLTQAELASQLRLLGPNSDQTVRRLETGFNQRIPGPTQVALECLVARKEVA